MNILLGLSDISKSSLDRAKKHILEHAEISESPIIKELSLLVVKALDYEPIDISINDLLFFKANYANQLVSRITQVSELEATEMDDALFWTAFYLHALQFETLSLKSSFGHDELMLGSFLETNFSFFKPDIQQRIRYLGFKLGADIANVKVTVLAKRELDAIEKKSIEINSAVEKIDGWSSKLEAWDIKVKNQESRLKDQLVKLNFVGLSKAFHNLTREKNTERLIHASISFFVATLFLATPFVLAYLYKIFSAELPDITKPSTIVPIVAFEFSLLYFFRVALQNYSSAKAQLLQLRLRLELCAFVEGYSEFIEPIREKAGSDTLAKFESIVFSGITLDPQKVPSQFDGIESILTFIKAIKNDVK